MWGIREQVSLLVEHGHTEAWSYPMGLVVQETNLVVSRWNSREALRARLTQAAVSATPNGFATKSSMEKLHSGFDRLLGLLTGEKQRGR